MKFIKNKLAYLFLILLLSACFGDNCERIDLGAEDLTWLEAYRPGDTLIMKSDSSRYDTLVLVNMEKEYTPCNIFELGNHQFQYALLTLKSSLVPTHLYDNVQLSIEIDTPLGHSTLSIYGFDLEYNNANDSVPINELEEKIFLPWKKDSIYSYRFTKSNSTSYGEHVIRSFNWSKKIGLVRYTIESGEVFDLIKRY